MNILCHGLPFFCDYATLREYRGAHVFRSISAQAGLADIHYFPERETMQEVLDRLAPVFVPDLIMFWTPENDPPPRGVEAAPVRTLAIAGDWNLFFAAQEYNLGRYDVVVSDK